MAIHCQNLEGAKPTLPLTWGKWLEALGPSEAYEVSGIVHGLSVTSSHKL